MPDSILRATLKARAMSRAEHRGRQAVLVVVGAGDRLFGALHAHDALHRAERFLAVDAHARRHVVEHAWPASAWSRPCRRRRASRPWRARRRSARCSAAPWPCRSPSPAPPAPACADRRAAGRVALSANFVDERHRRSSASTMMRSVDMQICPRVGEGAEGRGVDRVVDVGIVEHHHRRLAAELEHHRLQVACAQVCAMMRPTRVEPVKLTRRTAGCATMASTTAPASAGALVT